MAVETIPRRGYGLFRRPDAKTGWWSWMTTVDHKRIGILYGYTAFAFFVIGGLEALLIRLQLAGPNGHVLSANAYNQIFTMHGTTMIFLVVMPLSAAFSNYLLPLQIGARDVAFPRLNAFSYWVFIAGGLFMYSSFVLGGAPNGGWFGYAPLNEQGGVLDVVRTHNMDFWVIGLITLGIASTVSAVNLLVTVVNMRAPGMTLMRMPVFVWMTFVVQFLLVFALPILTIGLFELLFDRFFGTHFFDVAAGGDPLLWQHLFWLFGHPEVYVLILPAMGIVSEVLPVFARKPLFGYPVVVFSGIAIGFMGWGVWAHHMFAAGLGPVANSAFAASTMFIAVPTGVKIFNWIATLWRGDIRTKTPLLFAIGFVAMFIIGGLSGVTHSVVPADTQQTDTYYIVAHFHYVLFGGSIFGLFAGIYYWYPKYTGRLLREGLGKLHFWLMLIGFNLTFGPFHILGLKGMPRRIYTYPGGQGWDFWNLVSTLGAFMIALSILVFIANIRISKRKQEVAGNDPWDARTLEWTISSPPPEHNFDEIPVVHSLDDFWHQKYTEDESGHPVPVMAGGAQGPGETGEPGGVAHHGTPAPVEQHAQEADHGGEHGGGLGFHMPSPSYYPVLTSLAFPLVGFGLIYTPALIVVGIAVLLTGLYGWATEKP